MNRILLVCALFCSAGSLAWATDQPPQQPQQQRAWLFNHLKQDMVQSGAFRSIQLYQVKKLIDEANATASKNDKTVSAECELQMLTDYYCLTRKKAEQDLRQLFPTQPPPTQEELDKTAADGEKLLDLGKRLASAQKSVQQLSEFIYASVPGWCAQVVGSVPASYFNNGGYIGPLASATLAGPYAAAVSVPRTYVVMGPLLVDQRRWYQYLALARRNPMLSGGGTIISTGSGTFVPAGSGTSTGPIWYGPIHPGNPPNGSGPIHNGVVPMGSRGAQNTPLGSSTKSR